MMQRQQTTTGCNVTKRSSKGRGVSVLARIKKVVIITVTIVIIGLVVLLRARRKTTEEKGATIAESEAVTTERTESETTAVRIVASAIIETKGETPPPLPHPRQVAAVADPPQEAAEIITITVVETTKIVTDIGKEVIRVTEDAGAAGGLLLMCTPTSNAARIRCP